MQFFGHSVAAAMESFRCEGVPELQDSEPTIQFIQRMNSVIDAMNSQVPWEALKNNPDEGHHLVIFMRTKALCLFLEMLGSNMTIETMFCSNEGFEKFYKILR